MTNGGTGALGGLALGSGSALTASGIISGLDQISATDRTVLEELVSTWRRGLAVAPTPMRILVGAMRGKPHSDLRPLLLETSPERGKLSIIRVSAEILAKSAERSAYWERFIENLNTADLTTRMQLFGIDSAGEDLERFWVSRRFFPLLLSDALKDRTLLPAPMMFAQKLIAQILTLHQKLETCHGHIHPANVALDDGAPVLLDVCHAISFEPHTRVKHDTEVAPELSVQECPNEACDVWSLGRVFRELIGADLSPEKVTIVAQMTESDPAKRPSLQQVIEVLFPSMQVVPIPQVRGPKVIGQPGTVSGRMLRAGRVISLDDAQSSVAKTQITGRPNLSDSAEFEATSVPEPKDVELEKTEPNAPTDTPPAVALRLRLGQLSRSQDFSTFVEKMKGKMRARPYFVVGSLLVSVLLLWWALSPDQQTIKANYLQAWTSADPNLVESVARRAIVDRDKLAQQVIFEQTLNSEPSADVRSTLLKAAYSELWRDQLSATDKMVALRLGLPKLLVNEEIKLPQLSSLHPGVLFGLLADLPLEIPAPQFESLSIDTLTDLPASRGLAYAELKRFGNKSVGDLPVRALAHLLTGDSSDLALQSYFASAESPSEFLARLLIIVPFAQEYPRLSVPLAKKILDHGGVLAKRVDWFAQDPNVDWLGVPDADKLQLIVGIMPERPMSFEQYSDLLSFPAAVIRQEVALKLQEGFEKSDLIIALLNFLASEQNHLTRSQNVLLLSAEQLKQKQPGGEATFSFFSRWFQTNPDPQSVLELLLLHAEARQDPFNIEAARYLVKRSWRSSLEDLKQLSRHVEPLARALAYAKLEPSFSEDLEILQDAAKREQDARLKQQINGKLRTAAELEQQHSTSEVRSRNPGDLSGDDPLPFQDKDLGAPNQEEDGVDLNQPPNGSRQTDDFYGNEPR